MQLADGTLRFYVVAAASPSSPFRAALPEPRLPGALAPPVPSREANVWCSLDGWFHLVGGGPGGETSGFLVRFLRVSIDSSGVGADDLFGFRFLSPGNSDFLFFHNKCGYWSGANSAQVVSLHQDQQPDQWGFPVDEGGAGRASLEMTDDQL